MNKSKFLAASVIWCFYTLPVLGQLQKSHIEIELELRSVMLHSNATKQHSSLAEQEIHANHPTAFFCRQERALQEAIKIPIRFRLGEWNYTQQLEGKGHLHWKVTER